jgi:hypothetical protein
MKNKTKYKKYYIHINKPQIEVNDFEFYEISKLNKLKDNSISEVLIYDLLEYINYVDIYEIFKTITEKVVVDGKIHIQGTDLKSLCLAVLDSQIDSNIFRSILFGLNKKNIMSLNDTRKLIDSFSNITVNKIKFLNGVQYYIECLKNE